MKETQSLIEVGSASRVPSPRATMLALRLDCFTAALTTHQKVLPI